MDEREPFERVTVAVLGERLANFMEETRRAHKRLQDAVEAVLGKQEMLALNMTALERREGERNGQIRELTEYRIENEQHWGEHMRWATNEAAELEELKKAREEEALIEQTKRSVWRTQWKGVVAGFTLAGAVVAALAACIEAGIFG